MIGWLVATEMISCCGNGNDRLSGDKGHDVMIGGAGADGIDARDAHEDLVYADDLDTVIVDEFDTVVT